MLAHATASTSSWVGLLRNRWVDRRAARLSSSWVLDEPAAIDESGGELVDRSAHQGAERGASVVGGQRGEIRNELRSVPEVPAGGAVIGHGEELIDQTLVLEQRSAALPVVLHLGLLEQEPACRAVLHGGEPPPGQAQIEGVDVGLPALQENSSQRGLRPQCPTDVDQRPRIVDEQSFLVEVGEHVAARPVRAGDAGRPHRGRRAPATADLWWPRSSCTSHRSGPKPSWASASAMSSGSSCKRARQWRTAFDCPSSRANASSSWVLLSTDGSIHACREPYR